MESNLELQVKSKNKGVSVPLRGLSQWKAQIDFDAKPYKGRYCFSPLTGIKSVESVQEAIASGDCEVEFQSPYGD